jgi:hypothetical protein
VLAQTKAIIKKHWDKTRREAEEFMPGDQVLVLAERLPLNRLTRKFDDKWRGPFQIVAKKGPLAYELDLPESWRGYRVFNKGRLKCYHPPQFLTQELALTQPDPEFQEDGREEYKVKEVLAKRTSSLGNEYLV